jgi:hypothetical protein
VLSLLEDLAFVPVGKTLREVQPRIIRRDQKSFFSLGVKNLPLKGIFSIGWYYIPTRTKGVLQKQKKKPSVSVLFPSSFCSHSHTPSSSSTKSLSRSSKSRTEKKNEMLIHQSIKQVRTQEFEFI